MPLGRLFHRLAMSVYISVYISVPFSCNFFQGLSLALRSHVQIPAYHWSTPSPPPGVSRGFPGVFPGFSRGFLRVFLGFSWGFLRVFLGFSWGFPGVFRVFFRGFSGGFLKVLLGLSWGFPGVFRGLPGLFPGFFPGFSRSFRGVFPGFFYEKNHAPCNYFFFLFSWDKSGNLSKIVSVLLSTSVERFFVSLMRDFLAAHGFVYNINNRNHCIFSRPETTSHFFRCFLYQEEHKILHEKIIKVIPKFSTRNKLKYFCIV